MMFMGEFSHTIDAKGRLIIPSKFREALGDNIVVTVGLDKCLTLYTEDEFQNRASDLVSQTSLKGNVRALQRYMLSKAQNAEFDKQGRILISANLREFANKSFGVFQGEIYDVKLKFNPEAAEDASHYNFHPTQKGKWEKDGSYTVTFKASGDKHIMWHLFKWGDTVKIIAPKELKKKYKEYLQKVLTNMEHVPKLKN